MTVIFWLGLLLVAYSYLLYPALLAVITRLSGPGQSRAEAIGDPPPIACIIAAFNEERHIVARIENLLTQSYPAAKIRIYVGSDGSTDCTGALIGRFADDRVHAFVFQHNRGKASVLNDLVAASSEPILVFTDANTMFEPDALNHLVRHFSDPDVGMTCGELKLDAAQGNNQDSLYWRLEQWLKRCEARIGGLLGANGAIYALRRDLYRPLPADTITDDFCIAMQAAAEGRKLVYAPDAIAVEDTPNDIIDEYHRRVRIGIGNYQALFRHPEYLLSTNSATRFTYLSHKVLRWLTPHLLLSVLIASAVLGQESPYYQAFFLLQVIGYLAGGLILYFGVDRKVPRAISVFLFFLALNWAFLVAFVRFLGGRYSGRWRTTDRGSA